MESIILEWAYAREIMRCLGFSSDDLFFSVSWIATYGFVNGEMVKTNKPIVSLVLRAQNKDFTWAIGMTDLPPDKIQKSYEELCANLNAGIGWSVDDFQASRSFQQRLPLIEALYSKGFVFNPEKD